MNNWAYAIISVLLLYILIAYIIEVHLGSNKEVYNAELGMDSACGKRTQLSHKKFFRRFLPRILGAAAGLFLLMHLLSR